MVYFLAMTKENWCSKQSCPNLHLQNYLQDVVTFPKRWQQNLFFVKNHSGLVWGEVEGVAGVAGIAGVEVTFVPYSQPVLFFSLF